MSAAPCVTCAKTSFSHKERSSPSRCTTVGSGGQCESLTGSSGESCIGSPTPSSTVRGCEQICDSVPPLAVVAAATASQSNVHESSILCNDASTGPDGAQSSMEVRPRPRPRTGDTQQSRTRGHRRWSQQGRRQGSRGAAATSLDPAGTEKRRRPNRRRSAPAAARLVKEHHSLEEDEFSFNAGHGSN